jgi:hypothetical protein
MTQFIFIKGVSLTYQCFGPTSDSDLARLVLIKGYPLYRVHTVPAYIHTYIHTYTARCINTQCVHLTMSEIRRTPSCLHTYIHACIHTQTHTFYIHTYTHTYYQPSIRRITSSSYTYIHTYIHTINSHKSPKYAKFRLVCIHTYMHACIQA